MNKRDLKLKRKLELVRTTVRPLDAKQLEQVAGGQDESIAPSGCQFTIWPSFAAR